MTISFNQIPSDLVASKVAIELNSAVSAIAGSIIQQKILIVGQYNSGKTVVDYKPFELTGGLQEVKNKYGYGSMLALMAEKVFKNAGTTISVWVSPVPEASAGVKATGSIAVEGTATKAGVLYFYIAGKRVAVAVAKDDTDAEIATAIAATVNADLDLPVVAVATDDDVALTCKWKGATGNEITILQNLGGIAEENAAPTGSVITITAMASGATNPDIEDVFYTSDGELRLGGLDWFTIIVNPYIDSTSLTTLEDSALALADPLVKRVANCITGDRDTLATAQALAYGRNSGYNTIVHADSSPNLNCEIAAATAGQIAYSAQADPSRPFKTLILKGILPGEKLSYGQINTSEKKGLATTDITADGRVSIYDLVTTYKTNAAGASDDSLRYTVTISNLQAKLFSMDKILSSEPFVRAKIIDNDTVSSQEYAISPNVLKGFIVELIDKVWIANTWSKNRKDIVDSVQVEINVNNPSRLDVKLVDIIVLGERIIAVNYGYAFTPAV